MTRLSLRTRTTTASIANIPMVACFFLAGQIYVDEASACLCIHEPSVMVAPTPGVDDVPQNAVVLCRGSQCANGATVIVDDTGDLVLGAWSELTSPHQAHVGIFRPSTLWAPLTLHRVETYARPLADILADIAAGTLDADDPAALPTVIGTFKTADSVDDTEVATPIAEKDAVEVSGCEEGDSSCDEFNWRFSVTVPVAHDGILVLADVDERTSIDVGTLSGVASYVWSGDAAFRLSTSSCGAQWPDVDVEKTSMVRFAALSRTGTLSDWSDPVGLTGPSCPIADAPDEPGLACDCVAPGWPEKPPPTLLLFAFAGGYFAYRRRR